MILCLFASNVDTHVKSYLNVLCLFNALSYNDLSIGSNVYVLAIIHRLVSVTTTQH